MEEVRKVFYLKLQTLAVQIGEQYTDEGFDGDPSIEAKYAGHLVGNYPWLYLDYTVKGPGLPQQDGPGLPEALRGPARGQLPEHGHQRLQASIQADLP